MTILVSCVLTFSGSSSALERIKSVIDVHLSYDKPKFPVLITSTPTHTIIKFVSAWDPPNVNELTLCVGPSHIQFIRLAWSELEVLGYGWWQRVGNHSEKHTFDRVGGEVNAEGEAVGEYKAFLEEEGF